MFADSAAIATVAVKNAARAKEFYNGKLGLEVVDEREGVATYRTGGANLFVYESEYAGTNEATSATFTHEDVDAAVAELKSKGVAFEHYGEMPNLELKGDVYVGGDMKVAWFKDPDGNTLSIVSSN